MCRHFDQFYKTHLENNIQYTTKHTQLTHPTTHIIAMRWMPLVNRGGMMAYNQTIASYSMQLAIYACLLWMMLLLLHQHALHM